MRRATRQRSDVSNDGTRDLSARHRVCIVGASGKLGQYLVRHALARDQEVVAVCREQSVPKLDIFKGQIEVVPGRTNDRDVIRPRWTGSVALLGASCFAITLLTILNNSGNGSSFGYAFFPAILSLVVWTIATSLARYRDITSVTPAVPPV
jgi:hypothetical protein